MEAHGAVHFQGEKIISWMMINNYPYSYPARNLINSIFGIWIYCFSFVSSVKLYLYMQVATFIVQKIMLDDTGLMYVCSTRERFLSVSNVLAQMVDALVKQPSPRLLKHIIRCYLRLTDNPRFMLCYVQILILWHCYYAIPKPFYAHAAPVMRYALAFPPCWQTGHSMASLR